MTIFPRPQWLQERPAPPTLAAPVAVVAADPAVQGAAAALTREIQEQLGCKAIHGSGTEGAIVLGQFEDPIVVQALAAHGAVVPEEARRAGGYVLSSGPAGVLVAGFDAVGVFYGVQTLLQLFTHEGEQLRLPGVQIRDWPYKSVRGIHVYMPGRAKIPFFKRLLSWLASLKYNTIFLEVSGGMQYERRPEINQAWEQFCRTADAFPGGPQALQESQTYIKDSTHTELGGGSYLLKTEVAELLAYARSLHIEVIPEVQSLSHSYYLCLAYPELAERADDPYPDTYCPSNPKSYEVLFDVLEEVLEVFEPRVLHIGHDEIYHLGICPRCQGKSGADLLAGNINKVHAFLKQHGVRLGMWGDKLLPLWVGGRAEGGMEHNVDDKSWGKKYHIPETWRAIEQIPRDILISDWYWVLDPRTTEYFLREGFEVVLGNFGDNFAAQTYDRWNERAAAEGILGAEVSTWVEVSEFALGYNGCLFNFLFAAQMTWWSHYRDLDRAATTSAVAAHIVSARAELGDGVAPSRRADAEIVSLALDGLINAILPFEAPLSLPSGSPFVLAGQGNARRVASDAPAADLPVGRQAESLLLLQGCTSTKRRRPTWALPDVLHHPDENLLAFYHVHYTDGEQVAVPIHFGSHVANWDVPYGEHIDAVPYWADPVPAGQDATGRRVTLYRYEWINPRLEQPIDHVAVEYVGDPEGAFWLFGMAAVQAGRGQPHA